MCLDELAKYFRSNGVSKWWDSYLHMSIEINGNMYIYNKCQEEALIMFVFKVLMMLDKKDIELPKPIYGKGYPRYCNKWGMTYAEMNRIAEGFFGK
jgi:hypothetical protein